MSFLTDALAVGLIAAPETFQNFTEFVKRALSRGGFEFGEESV